MVNVVRYSVLMVGSIIFMLIVGVDVMRFSLYDEGAADERGGHDGTFQYWLRGDSGVNVRWK